MELKILSLNVRLWTKENNPFKPHFWLWRTLKQAKLFHRENPDIICLQEVQKPVGKFLLRLWKYKGFFTDTRIPIYIKKPLLQPSKGGYDFYPHFSGGTSKENGHGTSSVDFYQPEAVHRSFSIQNCHHSWETDKFTEEIKDGYWEPTIFCGDMNISRDRFIQQLKDITWLSDKELTVYPKTPEGPTYVSYGEPLKYRGDIDQFGYVGKNPPKAKVIILPDKVSDHFPILATIEI